VRTTISGGDGAPPRFAVPDFRDPERCGNDRRGEDDPRVLFDDLTSGRGSPDPRDTR
jgi:hypothetical protein